MNSAAWFVDGSYLYKAWDSLGHSDKLDYFKLRCHLEERYCTGEQRIEDAYYLAVDNEADGAKSNSFYTALSYPPPSGPGLRVKSYAPQRRPLSWPSIWGGGPIVHPQTGQRYEFASHKVCDIGLTFHLMRSFYHREWRRLFLAAGDGNLGEVVQHLVEHEGVELFLIGIVNTISVDLRPYAREIIRLDGLR